MPPKKKQFTYGTCAFVRTSPTQLAPGTKVLNVIVPFEEALKLNLAVHECVSELNSYNRSTKAGRNAARNLTL
jgi:hypothetical protein